MSELLTDADLAAIEAALLGPDGTVYGDQVLAMVTELRQARSLRAVMLDALEELANLTSLSYVTQDGPYVDGMLVRDLEHGRAALARARHLLGDGR